MWGGARPAPRFQAASPVVGPREKVSEMGSGGSLNSGYLQAVWREIFSPVFPGFLAEPDPGAPPRSPGPALHITCAENQTRRPSLRQFRGTPKSRQTAFRYPVNCSTRQADSLNLFTYCSSFESGPELADSLGCGGIEAVVSSNVCHPFRPVLTSLILWSLGAREM